MDETDDIIIISIISRLFTARENPMAFTKELDCVVLEGKYYAANAISGRGRRVVAQGDSINVSKTKGNTRSRIIQDRDIIISTITVCTECGPRHGVRNLLFIHSKKS